jgi:hypothetical protein
MEPNQDYSGSKKEIENPWALSDKTKYHHAFTPDKNAAKLFAFVI